MTQVLLPTQASKTNSPQPALQADAKQLHSQNITRVITCIHLMMIQVMSMAHEESRLRKEAERQAQNRYLSHAFQGASELKKSACIQAAAAAGSLVLGSISAAAQGSEITRRSLAQGARNAPSYIRAGIRRIVDLPDLNDTNSVETFGKSLSSMASTAEKAVSTGAQGVSQYFSGEKARLDTMAKGEEFTIQEAQREQQRVEKQISDAERTYMELLRLAREGLPR